MKKSLKEQLEFIFEGNDRKVTMDMVRLTDDQLEELIKQYPLVDDEEISENEIKNLNEVVARVKGKNIKLDSNFNIYEIDGIYYKKNKNEIAYAEIKDFTKDEKEFYRNLINMKVNSKYRKISEDDIVLPLLLSGRIKPNHWDLIKE